MQFSKLEIDIDLADFGISILMIYFAKYYSHGQYPLYVYTFKCIRELEIIERFLLNFRQNSIRLLPNMATHEEYGIKRQQANFTDNKHITVDAFNRITRYLYSNDITPQKFVEIVKCLNIHIIESFYIFTSITKNCKIINECHDLMHDNLKYTFQPPVKSLRYDGDYWFEVEPKSIWFAYFQGKVKFSSYIGCDIKNVLKIFERANVKCLVIGFIYDAKVYPIVFEDPHLYGDWEKTIAFMRHYQFNCKLNSGAPPSNQQKIHFVKRHNNMIFKLEVAKK
ncbi:GrBNV gp33-like protein [Tomelloso virus]|uniref:GrBNV gp33-like protein n=1 Tax=Tomelloso virus TaxID=2053981 RepID=A0A2H4T2S8_9VIRU|nr:GrBNV gp33-like protein [Tomelloso virus]ATY70226.1 GrBNV gp33-like protein [Tomelloso virus]